MTDEDVKIERAVSDDLLMAKREIAALHLLLATMIGDGNTAFIKKEAIAAGGKALKMSDDNEHFILEVVDVPLNDDESVV